MTLYHQTYTGVEKLICSCGCRGKKKPHVNGEPYDNGRDIIPSKAVFCGSCGRMLVNHHGEIECRVDKTPQ